MPDYHDINFSKKDIRELSKLWRNCLRRNEDPKAEIILLNIEKYWSNMNFVMHEINPRIRKPKDGMLSILGYHVGHSRGVSVNCRRQILNRMLIMELPNLYNSEYVKTFGPKDTYERRDQLKIKLETFAEGRDPKFYRKAIREWSSDAEWLVDINNPWQPKLK